MISPPLTADRELASLGGWQFVLTCPTCGERRKAVDDIATKPSILATPLSKIVSKFVCVGCGLKPTKLQVECIWAESVRTADTRIDLTWLLRGEPSPPPRIEDETD